MFTAALLAMSSLHVDLRGRLKQGAEFPRDPGAPPDHLAGAGGASFPASILNWPKKPKYVLSWSPPAAAPLLLDGVEAETLAAIAQGLADAWGGPVAIRSVRKLRAPDAAANSWAREGRTAIHASHQLAISGSR